MNRKKIGDRVGPLLIESIHGEEVRIPSAGQFTHLQFRRYAGCPICNLHLQSFIQRHDELLANNVQEVVVFHSAKSEMLAHQINAPLAFIADSGKKLYQAFGVESSLLSVLNPKAWPAGLKGVVRHGTRLPASGGSAFLLPAEFLMDDTGRIVALKYGDHASDQWQFDEVLELIKVFQLRAQPQP